MAQQDYRNNRLKAVALGLGLALSALTVRHWYGTFYDGHPPCQNCRADFPGFYAAAKLVWQQPNALYDNASQLAIQKTIDTRIDDSVLPFAYPPFTAIVLMPLGWLTFRSAFLVMTLANVLLLVATLKILIEKLELQKEQSTWLWLSTFCNVGVHSVLLQGQTSFIALLLLTSFMFFVRSGKGNWAGLLAGTVFFKPQLLAMPFIVLGFQRLRSALVIAVTVVVGLCIFSVTLVGIDGIGEYLRLLRFYGTTESGFGSYPSDMHNLRALIQYFVPFAYVAYFWLALVAPVAITTMWLNAGTCNDKSGKALLWIGNFLAALLIAPHLYPHDLSFLIVPSALILQSRGERVSAPLALILIIFGVLPILPLALGRLVPPILPILFLIGFVYCARSVSRAKVFG